MLRAAAGGLSLADEPFGDWGRPLGLSDADVVFRLRALVSQGVIDGVHLQPAATPDPSWPAPERELMDVLADGMPLVVRPFDLLGAMLDIATEDVRAMLQCWLKQGHGRCIAPRRPSPRRP